MFFSGSIKCIVDVVKQYFWDDCATKKECYATYHHYYIKRYV